MMTGRPLPWSDGDILAVSAGTAIGLVAIVAAWHGVSGAAAVTSQAGWLNLAVGGAVISAIGNALWLLRGRRAVGDRRRQLISIGPASIDMPAPGSPDVTTPLGMPVRVEGMHRIHRADCTLVHGKPVVPAPLEEGTPCGVCMP